MCIYDWHEDENFMKKKMPAYERKLFENDISSLVKRIGERKYLRALRLGSMTNVIKYHDEISFGFTFMLNPMRINYDPDGRDINPFVYKTTVIN